MSAYLFVNHLLNFAAPAAFIAVLMVLGTRFLPGFDGSNRPLAQSIWAQAAIIFIANVLVLLIGLVLFGRDGKMATYAALVIVAALCQWVLIRGWSRV
jgi:hypothetical protein